VGSICQGKRFFFYLTLKMVAKGDEMFAGLNSSLDSVGRRNKNKTGFPWFLTFPKDCLPMSNEPTPIRETGTIGD
jgi:hypothetical protein